MGANENPRVCETLGFSIPIFQREGLNPQAGYRLIVAIQPFDDVVAGYTSRDSDKNETNTSNTGTSFLLPDWRR